MSSSPPERDMEEMKLLCSQRTKVELQRNA